MQDGIDLSGNPGLHLAGEHGEASASHQGLEWLKLAAGVVEFPECILQFWDLVDQPIWFQIRKTSWSQLDLELPPEIKVTAQVVPDIKFQSGFAGGKY